MTEDPGSNTSPEPAGGSNTLTNTPVSVQYFNRAYNDNNIIGAGYKNIIQDSSRCSILNGSFSKIDGKINCHIIGDYIGQEGTEVLDHSFNIGCYNGVVSYGPLNIKRGGITVEEGQLSLGASSEYTFEGGQIRLETEEGHGTNDGLIFDAYKDLNNAYFHGENQWIQRLFRDSQSGLLTFAPGDIDNACQLHVRGQGHGHDGILTNTLWATRLELKNSTRCYIDFSIEDLWKTDFNTVDYNVRLMQGKPGAFFNGLEQVSTSLYIRSSVSDTVPANLYVQGDIVAYSLSDKNLKDNITRLDNCLSSILAINPVRFTWNQKQSTYAGEDIGLIAQEVKEIVPEVVQQRENETLAIRYEKLVPVLVGAIQEQQNKIEALEKKIEEIKKKL